MKLKLPIKTVNEANSREHWHKKSVRHTVQKSAILYLLRGKIDESFLPCIIKLTRIAPRKLDKWDNLPMSFKWILDAITSLLVPDKAIGQSDSDPRIQVEYEQIKGEINEYAIEVEIRKR